MSDAMFRVAAKRLADQLSSEHVAAGGARPAPRGDADRGGRGAPGTRLGRSLYDAAIGAAARWERR